tara:strand:- start:1639 stop:1779 length:141 start_codon:yes stop_codon:yes gene_type:complete
MRLHTFEVIEHLNKCDLEDHLIDVIAIAETRLFKIREEQGYCEWSY